MNDNKVVVEEILGFDVKFRTNNNEEKTLRFDFKNDEQLNSTISIKSDTDYTGFKFYTIEIKHECLGYSKEIL